MAEYFALSGAQVDPGQQHDLESLIMNRLMTSLWLILVLAVSACDWINTDEPTTEHKLYVYSNTAQSFYLLDYKTFDIVREIPLDVPEGVSLYGMTLSTNRDHLFFRTRGPYPDPPLAFAMYDIEREAFEDIFFTEFNHTGPVRFIAAQDESKSGLIYAHLRDLGTYAIDLFEQRVTRMISDEYDFALSKQFSHSPHGKWIVVHKNWSGYKNFTELEFYNRGWGPHDLQFTLNENDKDSISVYDFAFSADGGTLYVSYQLSEGRSRDNESYFGSYDLETRELHRSDLAFPWSLNPYYMAYSPGRKEAYLIGAYDVFYIIDTDSYEIKATVNLTGKVRGPSRIQIRPDDNVAFVSCADSDAIFVIDLDRREVVQTIALERPYTMIIP